MAEIRLPIVADFDLDGQNLTNLGITGGDTSAIRMDYIAAQDDLAVPMIYGADATSVTSARNLRIGGTVYDLGGANELNELSDVTITDTTASPLPDNSVLQYDDTTGFWVNVTIGDALGTGGIGDLGDVTITLPTGAGENIDNHILQYNLSNSAWENTTVLDLSGQIELDHLENVSVDSAPTGSILVLDGSTDTANPVWVDATLADLAGGTAAGYLNGIDLSDLADVDSTPANNELLIYNVPASGASTWEAKTLATIANDSTEGISLTNLNDVDVSSPGSWHIIAWDDSGDVDLWKQFSIGDILAEDAVIGDLSDIAARSNNAAEFLNGNGVWATPTLTGLSDTPANFGTDRHAVLTASSTDAATWALPTIEVQDEAGTEVHANRLVFVGSGIAANTVAGITTVTVTGGGGVRATATLTGTEATAFVRGAAPGWNIMLRVPDGFHIRSVTQTSKPADSVVNTITYTWEDSIITGDTDSDGDVLSNIVVRGTAGFVGTASGAYSWDVVVRPDGITDSSEDQTLTSNFVPVVYQQTYFARFTAMPMDTHFDATFAGEADTGALTPSGNSVTYPTMYNDGTDDQSTGLLLSQFQVGEYSQVTGITTVTTQQQGLVTAVDPTGGTVTIQFETTPEVGLYTGTVQFGDLAYVETAAISEQPTLVANSNVTLDEPLMSGHQQTFRATSQGTSEWLAAWIPHTFSQNPLFYAGGFQVTPDTGGDDRNVYNGIGAEMDATTGFETGYTMYAFEYKRDLSFEIRT